MQLAPLLLLLAATAASAQMYSWKDAKGVAHFSDQPPPDTAVKVQERPGAGGPAQPALPYALADAVRRHPVVLYTTKACDPCDQGRALLQQRGVPYTEKTVNTDADQQRLAAAGGGTSLPLLLVGSVKRNGFDTASWQEALSNASYPLQSRLPTGWRQPPAVAAAPAATPAPAAPAREIAAVRPETPPRKPPAANAPPGFQF